MKKFFCRCCGHQVSRNRRHISPGYFAACLWCDEDFFRFELREERGGSMTLDEIKKAAGLGLRVHWASPAYEVRRDSLGQWHIVCTHNGYTIGLTHRDGQTMNGAPEDFFIGEQP